MPDEVSWHRPTTIPQEVLCLNLQQNPWFGSLGGQPMACLMMRGARRVSRRGRSGEIGHISLALIVVLVLNSFVVGCASTDRLPPVPLAMASKVNVDIPDARFLLPDTDGQRMAALGLQAYKRALAAHHGKLTTAYFLAISGGGDDGAFGAGLLNGWSAYAAIVRRLVSSPALVRERFPHHSLFWARSTTQS